jgi:hypothetical protein
VKTVPNISQTLGLPEATSRRWASARATFPTAASREQADGVDHVDASAARESGVRCAPGHRCPAASTRCRASAGARRRDAHRSAALRASSTCSLSVAAGQKARILAPTAPARRRLFNAITGDFPPTAGRIHFFSARTSPTAAARAHQEGPAPHLPVFALSRPHGALTTCCLAGRGRRQRRAVQGLRGASVPAQRRPTVANHDLLERGATCASTSPSERASPTSRNEPQRQAR